MLNITDIQSKDIINAGRKLWNLAEPGYMEHSTHEYLKGLFLKLGFEVLEFKGIPGFQASVPGTSGAAPRIALIADMDALPLPGDPDGRYIHSCGHHMQMANLYGAARILSESRSAVLPHLTFMAIPAEEYIDFEKREPLLQAGTVSSLSGKQELLGRGVFQGFDMVVSTHGAGIKEPRFISSVHRLSGFEALKFNFSGKAAHAGAAPQLGINAQNAASLFLQACAFLRESFAEDDHIRIHPILTLPEGQSVNIIPDHAFVETYVRAATTEAIAITSAKLKAAAEGCAQAIGGTVDIEITPGYAPFKVDENMHRTLKTVVESMGETFIDEDFGAASSDVGDISQQIPSIMLGLPGANGLFHNPDFRIIDEDAAFALPSLTLALYLETLVKN